MLASGKVLKVNIYVSDGAKHHGVPLYSSIVDRLYKAGIAGATVVKGITGFGYRHRMHAAALLELSDYLPIVISFFDTKEKVDAVMPDLQQCVTSGLIEIQESTIWVPARPAH
jgi:uncharacterized protein